MFLKTVLKNDFKCYYLIFCKIKFYFETLLLACFLYFKNYNVLFFIILHICIINFWNIFVKLKNIYIDNIYFFFFLSCQNIFILENKKLLLKLVSKYGFRFTYWIMKTYKISITFYIYIYIFVLLIFCYVIRFSTKPQQKISLFHC